MSNSAATPAEGTVRNQMIRRAVAVLQESHDTQAALDIILCSLFVQWQMRLEYEGREAEKRLSLDNRHDDTVVSLLQS